MLLCSNALFVVSSAISLPSSANKKRSKPAHSITSSAVGSEQRRRNFEAKSLGSLEAVEHPAGVIISLLLS